MMQLDSDNLPTAGDPMAICPDLAAYWEARLAGKTPVQSFEEWLMIKDQMDEMWMEYRAKEIARSEKALVKGYRAAFRYFAEQDPDTTSVTLAPAAAVSEIVSGTVVHETTPTTSPRSSVAYRGVRQSRTKKVAYVPRSARRPLSMYEKKILKQGSIPAVLAKTPHLVQLELRERIWFAQAKLQRRTSRLVRNKMRAYYVANA
jgi:hypothetical protein